MSIWTSGLNPEQREAVFHDHGPLLILAGAGSGKTTVLVSRAGRLIDEKKIQAREICVLTFTNKAARELKTRVAIKLSKNGVGSAASEIWAGTFHSFGLHILRLNSKLAGLPSGFGVIDQGDATAIVKELTAGIKNSAKDSFKAETLLTVLGKWREKGQRRAQHTGEYGEEYETMAEIILPKFLKRLDNLGVVDFEGLLLKPLELFKEHPQVLKKFQERFGQVMVDEFQDTNQSQFQLVMGLAQQHQNLAVVGDDDQSIYGWRGACISNILDFPQRFKNCKVIRLERNYRSTPEILSVANQVIEKNKKRHGKVLRAENTTDSGTKPECFVYDNDDLEAEELLRHIRHFTDQGYNYRDVAILYRSNGQGALVESQLRQNQIPYNVSGGIGFFDRKEVRDLLAYLRCSLAPNEIAFRRIINTPSRGVGESAIENIEKLAARKNIGFVMAARQWSEAGVHEKAGAGLDALFATLARWPDEVLNTSGGHGLLKCIDDLGYRNYIREQCKDHESFNKRWSVIEIFTRVLDSFIERGGARRETLFEFIDSMELRDDNSNDEAEPGEEAPNKVQLLTLHASKGLEFPIVILIGVEEDLLPHRSLGGDIAEERRLFYVGITRAKRYLVLSRSRSRKRYGRYVPSTPSRFLLEIAKDAIITYESGARPLAATEKKNKIADLMKSLDGKIAAQKIDVNRK